MNENTNAQCLEDWEPCESGELRQMVWRVKTERRNREIIKVGGAFVVLLLCAFAATLIWQQMNASGKYDYGGISCKEVKSHLEAFKEGKIHDQQLVDSLRIHLDKCPHCGPAYKKMSEPATVSQVASQHEACGCESHKPFADLENRGPQLLAAGPAN